MVNLRSIFRWHYLYQSSVRERQLQSISKSKQDLNEALLVSTQKGDQIGDINIIRALSQTIEPENLAELLATILKFISSNIQFYLMVIEL